MEMLYGAPKQAIHLAADLRSDARQAAARERTLHVGDASAGDRAPAPAIVRWSVLATMRHHVGRRSAAHAGAR